MQDDPQVIKTDKDLGITVKDGSAYFSLSPAFWDQLNTVQYSSDLYPSLGPNDRTPATYAYSPPNELEQIRVCNHELC